MENEEGATARNADEVAVDVHDAMETFLSLLRQQDERIAKQDERIAAQDELMLAMQQEITTLGKALQGHQKIMEAEHPQLEQKAKVPPIVH